MRITSVKLLSELTINKKIFLYAMVADEVPISVEISEKSAAELLLDLPECSFEMDDGGDNIYLEVVFNDY